MILEYNGSYSTQSPGERSMLLRVREALARYRNLKGARIVEDILPVEGLSAPGGNFGPIDDLDQPHYTRGVIKERKVEMSDRKALAIYLQTCRRLEKQIVADLNLGFDQQAARKQQEYEDILKHIREITTPTGGIKYFPSSDTKDYQRQYQDFKYLLKKLKTTDPEVYHYLKKHVRTGITFTWVSDPD